MRHCSLSTKKEQARRVDVSLTVFISGVVVLEVLLVLVTMAVLIVPVLVAVLDVLDVTGSSRLRTNIVTTTAALTATNPKNKSPIIANFPHLIKQLTSTSFSSPPDTPSLS